MKDNFKGFSIKRTIRTATCINAGRECNQINTSPWIKTRCQQDYSKYKVYKIDQNNGNQVFYVDSGPYPSGCSCRYMTNLDNINFWYK